MGGLYPFFVYFYHSAAKPFWDTDGKSESNVLKFLNNLWGLETE